MIFLKVTEEGSLKVLPMVEVPNWNEIPLHTSVPYLAPEVVRRSLVDTSADMFSFGIIVWEMWRQKRVYDVKLMCDLDSKSFENMACLGLGVPPANFEQAKEPDENDAATSTTSADFTTLLLNPRLAMLESLVSKCCSLLGKDRPHPADALKEIKFD